MSGFYFNLFVWVILLVVFAVVEGMTAALTTIWFAIGAVAAGIATYFGARFYAQLLIFFVVSIIALLVTRPIAMKYLGNNKIQKTNVDALVGTKAVTTEEIDNLRETGKIRIHDVEWTARSLQNDTIPQGCVVEICEIQGVKAIVKQMKEE